MKRIQEQLPQMRRLWDENIPTKEISAGLGIAINTVNAVARRECWPCRYIRRPHVSRDWPTARRMWCEKARVSEIAERLGVSTDSVYARASKEQWPRRKMPQRGGGSHDDTPIPPIPKGFLTKHTKHQVRCEECYAVYEAKFMMLGGIEHDHVCPPKEARAA